MNSTSFGGVDNIKEELGKAHGRKPYFEQPLVLFSPTNRPSNTDHPKPILNHNMSDSPHSPTKWNCLWQLIDKHSHQSSQLPFLEDALHKNEVQERIFDKMYGLFSSFLEVLTN
jgi:hypothetical protein